MLAQMPMVTRMFMRISLLVGGFLIVILIGFFMVDPDGVWKPVGGGGRLAIFHKR